MILEEESLTTIDAVRTVTVLDHIKNNRIEYLLGIAILHLLGISDKIMSQVSGICF
jgi:aspartate carbamoyltransferase regulatory subunit